MTIHSTERKPVVDRQRQEIREECARLGVRIIEAGTVIHLRGRGVNLSVTDLRDVLLEDLGDFHRTTIN